MGSTPIPDAVKVEVIGSSPIRSAYCEVDVMVTRKAHNFVIVGSTPTLATISTDVSNGRNEVSLIGSVETPA